MPSPSLTLLRTQSDGRLADLAREGHERAFEAIVERYRRPLLRAARRVLPEGRAEDALQQALLAAWTALQRGDEVQDLRPWLYRIVHNTSLNALRMGGYDYAELHEAARIADAGDDELERRAVVRQTLASLAALPERQREALIRTALSGHSQEEVARDLGLSDNALRQLVHRARVSMRTAATALTPMPLVTAAASGSGGGPVAERIAEAAAGGGASLTLAKAGTVAVLAGGALTGPALVHRVGDRATPATATADAASVPRHAERSAAAAQPERPAATAVPRRRFVSAQPQRRASAPLRPTATRQAHPERRSRGSRPVGSDDRGSGDDEPSTSGRRPSSDDESDTRGTGGSSGPGSTEDREISGSPGHDGSGESSVSGSSGPGSSGSPAPEPEPDGESSGSGDGSREPEPVTTAAPLASATPAVRHDEHDS